MSSELFENERYFYHSSSDDKIEYVIKKVKTWMGASLPCPFYNKSHDDIMKILKSMQAYGKVKSLTHSQSQYLLSMNKKYSQNSYHANLSWDYSEERKKNAKIASEFYSKIDHGAYFKNTRTKVDADENLTCEEYQSLCENKYSERIIDELTREPRFKKGDKVQIRINRLMSLVKLNNTYFKNSMREQYAIVIEDNAKMPITCAKGCRTYKILPVGYPKPIYAEERDLKRAKKIK